MAVAVAGTPATSEGTTSGLTFSVTVPAGASLLVVRTASDSSQPTGVTFGGVALTSRVQAGPSSGNDLASVWTLTSPAASTANVVVSFAVAREVVANASAYGGVNTASPVGTAVGEVNPSADNNPSIDVTSQAGGLVVDVLAAWNMGTVTVGPSPQAEDYREDNTNVVASGFGSSKPGAASVTVSWTKTNAARPTAHAALPLNPAGGGAPPVFRRARRVFTQRF